MIALKFGEKTAKIPVIQGGMGVGVSRCKLAGAVAKEGGVGIISTAQIGYDEEDFAKDPCGANERAIAKHIRLAKERAEGNGLVGVNIMVALKHYAQHVKAAVEAGADVIISGAGLPITLPGLVGDAPTKIAPIVSTAKAANVILKMWDRKFKRTADFIVIEGPEAGGHLGFSKDELAEIDTMDYDTEIKNIICVVKEFADKYKQKIPVVVAGGIFTREDVAHAMSLGADGVQVATRFVATEECDASEAYKQAYIDAKTEDIEIIQSPVGMPGRAVNNAFIQRVKKGREPIEKCYQCLGKCNPAEIPYCITDALTKAVEGDLDHGLIFCGTNANQIDHISTVHEVMQDLAQGFEIMYDGTECIA